MIKSELYWLAGFYEGEGSCGRYTKTSYSKTGKKYVYPRGVIQATIAQKDKDIIKWIHKKLGYGHVEYRQNRKSSFGKSLWCWKSSHRGAIKFLTMIYPYLRINRRKQQVREALK